MRLFVALEIPAGVRANLSTFMNELRVLAPPKSTGRKIRWTPPDNIHLTLKFIGNTSPDKLDAVVAALSAVQSPRAVDLQFRSTGCFPNQKRARVLWAGVESSPNLASLAAAIDENLGAIGFERETRAFTPHLTLARMDSPGLPSKLRDAIGENAASEFGMLHTSEFHLIESKVKRSGAEYTTLRSFPFAPEA